MTESEPSTGPLLGGGVEFDTIRRLLARWGNRAIGVGDDAAVVQLPRGDALVASSDAFVEGHHFRSPWLSAREIGYKAVTAALSDLAAMAAQPLGILVNISVPERWLPSLDGIADGIGDALDAAGTSILGGNLTAAGELNLTTTVLGSAFSPLRRTGLRPGDGLYVTGRLGGPGAAVAAWERGGRGAMGGSLKVETTHLKAGFLRKNGIPYSENAQLTEYYDLVKERNGDQLRSAPSFWDGRCPGHRGMRL